MNDENELLEPLATEAGQQAIVRAIRDISSLEYAVRAEQAASTASVKAGEASQSAIEASEAEDNAKDWATKTDTYVEQEMITIPPEQEGEEPTTETINLYSARYYAALAQDIYNNMSFDSVPTENSTNMVNSGTVYSALDLKADKSTTYTKTETDNLINTRLAELVASAPAALDTLQELATALGNDPNFATTIATQLGNKADKSDTYTKTEVDTALSNVQSTLTFDNVPTANSNNPVKSGGIKTALDGKQDTLTFDSTPTANSTNPVTSGGVYTALQNVDANIEVDTEITEDSDNPVTSAAIYEALQNFTPSGGGGGAGNASGVQIEELFNDKTNGWNSGTLTLNKEWSGYDFICIVWSKPDEGFYSNTKAIEQKLFPIQYFNDVYQNDSNVLLTGYSTRHMYFKLQQDKKSFLLTYNVDCKIWQVYGIKFSKNLSEQMYSNVLYENSSGWSSGSITLSDSLENYDFIEVLHKLPSDPNTNMNTHFFSTSQLLGTGRYMSITGYASRYFNATVVSSTQLSVASRSDDSIYKIVGYKMAKGGYSGIVSDARMTVKSGIVDWGETLQGDAYRSVMFDSPMPDTNYIVLTSREFGGGEWAVAEISIKDKTVNGFTLLAYSPSRTANNPVFRWIAIRPNSYTREGMVEDVLFSNASGVKSGTINLSGNISDYDLISFKLNRYVNDIKKEFVFSANYFEDNEQCILNFGEMSESMTISKRGDNTITIMWASNNSPKIVKITGIKFGRYVSGVAVDTTVTQNSNAVVTSGAVYDALQNAGGGSSITVDSTITQGGTNPVEGGAIYTALGDKADKSTTYTKTEVDTALSSKGDVTTNTDQNITGTKTFVGSKKVAFKQSTSNDKLGFTLYGNTGTERGYLEFNPTNTVDGVTGLMTLGNYATSAASLTQVGFRRYSNISGQSGAYNLLMPMVADARTPFSLTTTYQNFYLPLGFTDGTTTVRTAKSGVVDLSPLLASLEARIAVLEGN